MGRMGRSDEVHVVMVRKTVDQPAHLKEVQVCIIILYHLFPKVTKCGQFRRKWTATVASDGIRGGCLCKLVHEILCESADESSMGGFFAMVFVVSGR